MSSRRSFLFCDILYVTSASRRPPKTFGRILIVESTDENNEAPCTKNPWNKKDEKKKTVINSL